MSTYQKGKEIIAEQIEQHTGESSSAIAEHCMDALAKKRLALRTIIASAAMLKRFHSHCRHLGNVTGQGYENVYSKAINAAVKTEDWPVKIIPRSIRLDTGDIVEVDVPIPLSTTKVTNGALMAAYQVIQDEAQKHGVDLPEEE